MLLKGCVVSYVNSTEWDSQTVLELKTCLSPFQLMKTDCNSSESFGLLMLFNCENLTIHSSANESGSYFVLSTDDISSSFYLKTRSLFHLSCEIVYIVM